MRCPKPHSNTSNCSWSRAWKNIFRSRDVFATRICAQIGSRSLPKSTSKLHSSRPTTFSQSLKECSLQSSRPRATSTSKCHSTGSRIARRSIDTAAINAKGFAGITTGQIEELTEKAKLFGAKGLAFIKIENGEWKSPIVKFFSDGEKAALQSKLRIEEGDLILFGADRWETACEVLGRIRLRVAEIQKLTPTSEVWDFLWVTDFPLLQWSVEENKWNAMHHPFTRPKADDVPLFDAKKFGEIRAEAYDVVLNGVEIGGGSMRIHEPELQEKMFEALGIRSEDRQSLFGHLLRALRLGAPPHGGIALGLDRLVMLVCGEDTIRDVMAFPKNNRGLDLMTQSPADVDPRQLRDLSIKLTGEKKSAEHAPSRP